MIVVRRRGVVVHAVRVGIDSCGDSRVIIIVIVWIDCTEFGKDRIGHISPSERIFLRL